MLEVFFICHILTKSLNTFKNSSVSDQVLSNEKGRCQELSSEVQRLNQNLLKAHAELKTVTSSLHQSQGRIESLSQDLAKGQSLLQLPKTRGSTEVDNTSISHSDSTNTTHICESLTQVTSHLHRSSETGKGRSLSMTHDHVTAETERRLSERMLDLEKEVCITAERVCA